ncbi:sigma-54 interaction domain-containing protein [Plasticicumulans acidivorans]|uniref:Sigma-54 interacting transcriptional regulator n=1 Tax=Plasticicumulans acidivorans TaxID=886464 RepID=A0A317MTY4_9GAMM|nr:sigma-54 dependent transcriptional regulator [Plasticicumulans acidivorans]PWV61178.1 sigma-54 interacting transcriptional regulator [Plasticicumulans acidivorans]
MFEPALSPDLLLAVWRLLPRAQPLASLLEPLRRLLGLEDVGLCGVDAPTQQLLCQRARQPCAALALDADRLQRLADWCHHAARTPQALAELPWLPLDAAGSWVLALDGEPPALALFTATAGTVDAARRAQWAALAEPLALAVELARQRRRIEDLEALSERLREQPVAHRPVSGEAIVGADGGLRQVLERVRLVASTDVPVLLLGETGSGKEVIARAIHDHSPRAAADFVRVNCGAIPPELIDSALFGHERGAFTGATTSRRGWFEQADGGTLFLDEIGELPLAAQVRLLRILQDGQLQRVGGEATVQLDVRVVAATHRDLPAMAQNGRFREDLWYRLSTFPIVLPPLRERREDLPALAAHCVRRAAHRFGVAVPPILPADLARLAAYDWPGNVREFAAVIDRAILLGEGRRLDVATALGTAAASAPPAVPSAADAAPPLATLDAAMREHIARALAACAGRIEGPHGAAAALAINPHTLRARMRRLGLDWRRYRPL